MSETKRKGRVTIPTDVDVVPETLEILERWGADAIRDCDGTDYPEAAQERGRQGVLHLLHHPKGQRLGQGKPGRGAAVLHHDRLSIPPARRAAVHPPDEGHQPGADAGEYPGRHQALVGGRWTAPPASVVPPQDWRYDEESGSVVLDMPVARFHEYTVSFLAYLIWDPVHMYNAVTNGWKDFEHQITFDVRQPKTHKYTMERLRKFIAEHPYVNVIRYTTFFHQFTLVFDELKREKYVDWYGYSACVSPLYPGAVRAGGWATSSAPSSSSTRATTTTSTGCPQQGIQGLSGLPAPRGGQAGQGDGGHHPRAGQGGHDVPGRPLDRHRAVHGRSSRPLAWMPWWAAWATARTLRLISDIPGVKYTEGRFLPYFFPDTFHEGGDPVREAKENWVTARRAILRKPIDRIGYGGYLKLACAVPGVHRLCGERVQRVPRAVRQHQGHDALLRQDRGRAELLGQNARLGLPHGAPRAVSEAELQLCRRNRGAVRRAVRCAVHQL